VLFEEVKNILVRRCTEILGDMKYRRNLA